MSYPMFTFAQSMSPIVVDVSPTIVSRDVTLLLTVVNLDVTSGVEVALLFSAGSIQHLVLLDESLEYCQNLAHHRTALVAPYCARLSRRYPWGFWCLNMTNWVRSPLTLFRAIPLGEHAKWRCDPPHKRGILARLARYPMKTRQNE